MSHKFSLEKATKMSFEQQTEKDLKTMCLDWMEIICLFIIRAEVMWEGNNLCQEAGNKSPVWNTNSETKERKCEKNAVFFRGKETKIWRITEGGVREFFIPRPGCIPACLALNLMASCFFFTFTEPKNCFLTAWSTLQSQSTTQSFKLVTKGAECLPPSPVN